MMIECTHRSVKDMDVVCQLDEHLNEVVNPCWNYAGRIKSEKDEVMNAVLGLAGEAGEVADQVKKIYYHTEKSADVNREKIRLELGDVIFYWLKTAELFSWTPAEILAGNREKLESRHPEMGKVNERFGKDWIR